MGLKPTEEQEAILDAFDDEESFVVAAGAGTGKTSTLVMATDGQRDLKGLYVVFNKSAATEAERRFHDRVEVTTAHSLAHRWMRRSTDENARLLEKLNAPWSYDHVVAGRIFSGSAKVTIEVATEGKPRKFGPLLMSRMSLAAVKRYCQSGDVELGPEHVVCPETLSPAVWESHAREALTEHVLPGARRALADAFDPRGDTVPFSHEMYLKVWSLAAPDLSRRFDYLLFDEAQDANPAMAEVVLAQKGRMQIVVVGDQNQAINGFMGAQDAIGRFRRQHPDARVLPLTRSYRFGPEIASRANSVLGVLGSELVVEGGGGDGSVRLGGDRFDGVDAVLVRTNAGAIEEALAAVAADLVPYLHTDTKAMLKFLEGAEKLVGGKKASHPSLEGFSTWREFEEFVRSNDSARREHGLSVSLVAEYGAANLVKLLSRVTGNTERGSDVTISTAHKVKGLEWEGVRLGDDFPDEFDATPDGESELMLAYVAATRARSLLLPGLLWPLTEHGVALSETALGPVRSLAAHELRRDPTAHASEVEAFEAALSTRLDELGRPAPSAAAVAAAVAAYLALHPGPAAPYEAPGTKPAPSSSVGAGSPVATEEKPRRAPGPRDLVLPDGRTVMVWKRFAHHRLYVNSEEGVRLGFGDVKTGVITVESGERSEVVDAVEAHPDWALVAA